MIRWVVIIAVSTFFGVLTVIQPGVLATNEFLQGFVSHEIIALLIVVLTITLASVGNIHLTLTRIVRKKFDNQSEGELAAAPARAEIDSSAWGLFWAFGLCILVLILKGAFPHGPYIVSAANGAALVILLFNLMVMHDLYKTVYELTKGGHVDEETKG